MVVGRGRCGSRQLCNWAQRLSGWTRRDITGRTEAGQRGESWAGGRERGDGTHTHTHNAHTNKVMGS